MHLIMASLRLSIHNLQAKKEKGGEWDNMNNSDRKTSSI